MLLLNRDPTSDTPGGPRQGVIEDARRRQRRRRRRASTIALIAAASAALAWALVGARSPAQRTKATSAGGSAPLDASDAHAAGFNIRLVPMVSGVGQAGWCEVVEEHGVTGGSACGGLPTPSQPFLQIYSSGEASSREVVQAAVTDPQITAVLVNGRRRVPTVSLPGLPYGLRGARIVAPRGAALTPLDEHGRRIDQHWTQAPSQATVSPWRYPQPPAKGVCQLRASGLPGLSVVGGTVATVIRPFPDQLVGYGFVPCAITEYLRHGIPIKAILVLDAAQPGSRPAALPNFHAVRGAPGIFAGGGLTAMRSGNAWLLVGQGRGASERILLLRHLRAANHAAR